MFGHGPFSLDSITLHAATIITTASPISWVQLSITLIHIETATAVYG